MWLAWFLKVSLLDGKDSLMWIFCLDFFCTPLLVNSLFDSSHPTLQRQIWVAWSFHIMGSGASLREAGGFPTTVDTEVGFFCIWKVMLRTWDVFSWLHSNKAHLSWSNSLVQLAAYLFVTFCVLILVGCWKYSIGKQVWHGVTIQSGVELSGWVHVAVRRRRDSGTAPGPGTWNWNEVGSKWRRHRDSIYWYSYLNAVHCLLMICWCHFLVVF